MISTFTKMFFAFVIICVYTVSYGRSHDIREISNGKSFKHIESNETVVDNIFSQFVREKRDVNVYAKHLVGVKTFYDEPELFNDLQEIMPVKAPTKAYANRSSGVEPTSTPVELCQELQKKMGRSSSDFIECAILKARPITMCLSCVVPYNETLHIYEKLMEVHEDDMSCKDEFLGKDRLQILQVLYVNSWNLWDQAHCNSCYAQLDSKTGKSNLSLFSDTTSTFLLALSQVTDCFNNVSVDFSASSNGTNNTCIRCEALYRNLSSIYKSILMDQNSDYSTGVCMDITDAMNVTQQRWNNEFSCKHFGTNFGYPVLLLTISIGIVPILFYTAAKILASVEDIKLVFPKRKSFVQDSARLQM